MPQYLCVDGPLAGQLVDWREPVDEHEVVTMIVVDVVDVSGPDVDADGAVDYRVAGPAVDGLPGRLRFAGRRGSRPRPRAFAPAALAGL